MSSRLYPGRKGFTLTELLVATAILAFLLASDIAIAS